MPAEQNKEFYQSDAYFGVDVAKDHLIGFAPTVFNLWRAFGTARP